jgi:hypothetical protein
LIAREPAIQGVLVKKGIFSVTAWMAVLALSVSAGGAANLQITGFYLAGANATIQVYNPTLTTVLESGTFGSGSFSAMLDGVPLTSPLYCLDLFHSFSFGQNWDVTPIIVPPDPPNPPPGNTGMAAWVYHKYGLTAAQGYQAGGVQLALWEMTHDLNWQSGLSSWWDTGVFRYSGSLSSSTDGGYADLILHDVALNYNLGEAGNVVYYQVSSPTGPGQGQIGDSIPEPATLLLLGSGLCAAVLSAWRKRNS